MCCLLGRLLCALRRAGGVDETLEAKREEKGLQVPMSEPGTDGAVDRPSDIVSDGGMWYDRGEKGTNACSGASSWPRPRTSVPACVTDPRTEHIQGQHSRAVGIPSASTTDPWGGWGRGGGLLTRQALMRVLPSEICCCSSANGGGSSLGRSDLVAIWIGFCDLLPVKVLCRGVESTQDVSTGSAGAATTCDLDACAGAGVAV